MVSVDCTAVNALAAYVRLGAVELAPLAPAQFAEQTPDHDISPHAATPIPPTIVATQNHGLLIGYIAASWDA
jgi:hypothetical protein